MKIRFVGYALDATGYGEFARLVLRALHGAGHDLSLDILSMRGEPSERFGAAGELVTSLPMARGSGFTGDLQILCSLPTSFDRARVSSVTRVGYTMAERDCVPSHWAEACNRLSGLLVPSRSSREAFRRSGVTVPIEVLPPPFFVEELAPFPKIFTFASVFDWAHPHKDPKALFRAYYEEFTEADPVSLAVKTFRSSSEHAFFDLREWKAAYGGASPARVRLTVGSWSSEEMRKFYQEASAVVACHRGEGFGLSMWEAAAHGRAVIATGHGGATELFEPDEAFLVDYDRNGTWAETNVASLRKRMREAYGGEYSPWDCRRTGERARTNFEYRHGPTKFAAAFEAAMRRMLE